MSRERKKPTSKNVLMVNMTDMTFANLLSKRNFQTVCSTKDATTLVRILNVVFENSFSCFNTAILIFPFSIDGLEFSVLTIFYIVFPVYLHQTQHAAHGPVYKMDERVAYKHS